MVYTVGDATIDITANGDPFLRAVRRITRTAERDMDRWSNSRGVKFGQALSRGLAGATSKLATFSIAAAAAGPAVMALGSAMSAAAAGATALVGAMGPPLVAALGAAAGGALAAGQGMVFAKMAFKDMSKAIAGDKKVLATMGKDAKDFAGRLRDLKPGMEAVRRQVQAGLFPGLGPAIEKLAKTYFPMLEAAGRSTGEALGSLATRGASLLTSGPWREDFATLTKANTNNLMLLGQAMLPLLDIIRNLLVTSAPLATRFLVWAKNSLQVVAAATEAGRQSGKLADWFSRAGDMAAQWGDILGNLSTALFNVFALGNSGGQAESLLTYLQGITAQFQAWTESSSGRQSILDWFAQGRANLEALGRLLKDVTTGFAGLGTGEQLAPLIEQIRQVVIPPLFRFFENTSASGALTDFIDAIGKFANVLADMAGTYSSLKSFSVVLGAFFDAVQWAIDNIPGASAAMGTFFVVLGGWKALNLVGLGPAIGFLGTQLWNLVAPLLASTAAFIKNTVQVGASVIAYNISHSTIGTWLGVQWLTVTATLRSAAALAAQKAAMVLTATWTGIVTAAQWAWNAAMSANPIGLIIIGIAALIAGIVLLWKKSETFRNIVKGAWEGIKKAASAVVDWFTGSVLPWLQGVWDGIASGAQTMWGWIQTAWDGIKNAAQAAWDFMSPVFDFIAAAVQRVIDVFKFLSQFVVLYFQVIRLAIQTAWFVIKTVFGWITQGVQWLGEKFTGLYNDYIKPAWDWITGKIGDAWDWVQAKLQAGWDWIDRNVLARFRAGLDLLKSQFDTVKTAIGNAWDWVKSKLAAGWAWIRDNVLAFFQRRLDTLKANFDTLKTGIGIAWDWIKNKIQAGWEWIRDKTFTPFKSGLDSLKSKFETVKDNIGKVWDGLKEKAKAPIKFVINTVLNDGLIAGFNWLAEKIGGSKVDRIKLPAGFATGGILPGYTPGRDVHRFYSPTGGRLDLSGGEPIMRPEFGRVVGKGWIDKMNAAARRGGTAGVRKALGFADGGIFPGGYHAYAGGGLIDWIKSKASDAFAWVSDKASDVYQAVTNPMKFIEGKLPSIPGGKTISTYGKAVVGKGKTMVVDKITALWKRFKDAFDSSGVGGVSASTLAAMRQSGTGYKAMAAWLRTAAPWATVTSGYRPGAITAIGNPSRHGMGLALDMVPPGARTFNAILKGIGQRNIAQLFSSQMGISNQIVNGRRVTLDRTTFGDHFDHVHWAMKNGGILPMRSYDMGGYLPPGLSLAHNGTGRPEPVGFGGDTVYVSLNVDISKLRDLEDVAAFLEMIRGARAQSRMTARSGTVSN